MDEMKSKSTSKEEIHLLDYLIIMAKRSRMIVFATLGIMVLTYLYLLLLVPKEYTATVRLIPPQQSMTLSGQLLEGIGISTLPGGAAGLGSMAAGLLGLKNPNLIYVGMLNGNTVYDRIIDRFKLKELYNLEYIEDVRLKLSKKAIIQATDDGLITIEVTDRDQKRAADMANAFAEELDKLLKGIALQDAKNQLAFLEEQRSQTLTNLTKAEEELRTFSEKSGVIQLASQVSTMIAYVATLRAEIDGREVQIQGLKKQATPFNFDVVRLETEVNSLKEKLKEAERQVDKACIGDVCLPTSKVPELGVKYIRFYREVRYQETLYEVLCKLVELARLDAAKNISVARVQFVDRAIPPEKKSKPQRLLITLIVGMATFFLLIIYVFVREYWDRNLQEADNRKRFEQFQTHMQQWRGPLRKILSIFKKKV